MIDAAMARAEVKRSSADLIDFTQRLVATPSISGSEGDVAQVVVDELKKLKFDEVWTDDVGNVIGKINGSGGPAVMLNGHMDVVDPGPPEGWPQPAYSGAIVDGELWGRGSVDMKGPVASMIYGCSQFKQLKLKPPGDVLMTVAVMEEIGGLGSQFMVRDVTADAAIVGEPSRNALRLGHRGRMEIQIKFHGRSAHASAPDLAINPHFAAAEFLSHLHELELGSDPVLGASTIAPTLYRTDQQSANVIPSEVVLYLDWRNVPAETTTVAVDKLNQLVKKFCGGDSPSEINVAEVAVTSADLTTYTGHVRHFASVFPPFATCPESDLAVAAKGVVDALVAVKPADVWQFATDGGHLVAAGIPVVGFGPGDDRLAHTNQERIVISDLTEATAVYAPLIVAMAAAIEQK